MNTKLKSNFIRSSVQKNQGFAMPMAMMVGLLLLGVGISMVAKSQGDTTKIATQQVKADGLTVAEVGVARVLELLQTHRHLIWYDSAADPANPGDPTHWAGQEAQVRADFDKRQLKINACPDDNPSASPNIVPIDTQVATIASLAKGEPQYLPALEISAAKDDAIQRSYRLVSYDYQGETEGTFNSSGSVLPLSTAKLIVEGRSVKGQKESISRIEVEIDVDNTSNNNFALDGNPYIPGLWIKEGTINDIANKDAFNTWLKSRKPAGDLSIKPATFDSHVLMSERCFEPEREEEIKEWAYKYIAPVPPGEEDKRQNYNPIFVEEEFPSPPPTPPVGIPEIDITSDLTLPLDEDCHKDDNSNTCDKKGKKAKKKPVKPDEPEVDVYEYKVSRIELTGSETLTITPGKKVILYVTGDITTGEGGIIHDCFSIPSCKPTNLQIFTSETPGKICLGGSNPLYAFIFAPNHDLGKKGSGIFSGAIWGKSWGKIADCPSYIDPSPTVSQLFMQGGEWDDLYQDLRPAIPLPRLGQKDDNRIISIVKNWRQIIIKD